MDSLILEEFQYLTEEQLKRNSSLLDLMTKTETTGGKINRALSKAITHCGCIRLDAQTHQRAELTSKERAQIKGTLCDTCREELEKVIGEHLFYLTGLLGPLDLSLYDLFLTELGRQKTLGKYNLR